MAGFKPSAEPTPDWVEASADPALVEAWLRARSVARGLPQPLKDQGGWRLETGLPNEVCRYVFAAPCAGLRNLASEIDAPRVFLKLCASDETLRAMTPPRWSLQRPSFMMICDRPVEGGAPLASGYKLETDTVGAAVTVRVLTIHGAVAASGHAAEFGGAFVYDRIETDAAHRRRGLGRVLMSALGSARRSKGAREVLVATPEGRALYETLGWMVHAPYATAVIPTEA